MPQEWGCAWLTVAWSCCRDTAEARMGKLFAAPPQAGIKQYVLDLLTAHVDSGLAYLARADQQNGLQNSSGIVSSLMGLVQVCMLQLVLYKDYICSAARDENPEAANK